MGRKIKSIASLAAALSFTAFPAYHPVWAQSYESLPLVVPGTAPQPLETPAAPAAGAAEQQSKFTAEQLREMVGPIALYPDPLLAQVLAASTYPLDIVQASRFIKANEKDPALSEKVDAQAWDPSVQSLARYPSVLALLDENLEWTQNLGAAFLYQQAEVMAAIQDCRAQAQAAGNLATTKEQAVVVDRDVIQILPADPQVIYVPVYEPQVVYVERDPFYIGPVVSFGFGIAVGYWLDLDCDWHHHRVYHGGWYHRHHQHHGDKYSSRYGNGYGYNNGHNNGGHGSRGDRDDDRRDGGRDGGRDRDGDRRDGDGRGDGDRRNDAPAWRHNDSKPAPQLRPVASGGKPSLTPTRGDNFVRNGNNVARSADAERTAGVARTDGGDRGDRAARGESAQRTEDGNTRRHTFRPTASGQRTVTGVSRNINAPITPGNVARNDSSSAADTVKPAQPPTVRTDRPQRDDRDGRPERNEQPVVRTPSTPAAPSAPATPRDARDVRNRNDGPTNASIIRDSKIESSPRLRPPASESDDKPRLVPTPAQERIVPRVTPPAPQTPRSLPQPPKAEVQVPRAAPPVQRSLPQAKVEAPAPRSAPQPRIETPAPRSAPATPREARSAPAPRPAATVSKPVERAAPAPKPSSSREATSQRSSSSRESSSSSKKSSSSSSSGRKK